MSGQDQVLPTIYPAACARQIISGFLVLVLFFLSFSPPPMNLPVNRTAVLKHHCNLLSRACSSFPSPSPDAYSGLIERYSLDQALQQGKTIHARLIISGLACLTRYASKLIAFYVGCGQLCNAHKLFDGIPQSDVHRWVVLTGACSRHGFYGEALSVFSEMIKHGLGADKYAIPSVLKACGHMPDVRSGKMLHCVILKDAVESDVFILTALIDMYSKCGQVEKARRVFNGMVEKDLVALNAVVSGYAQHGFAKEAFALLEEVQVLGVQPNVVTWNSLIAGFAQEGDEGMISKIFELMLANGTEPDVVSWTSVMSGLVQSFHYEAAFRTFKQMLEHGFYPNSSTISSLLPAYATLANVRRGKEIHGYAVVTGFECDIYVRSALVDMYAKCGFISKARMLFSKMTERNTVTWNSMIFGYANHGYCNEAIELFNQMEKMEGKKLDHLTFTAVLTACGHARMVEMGQSLFSLMQEKYKIVPRSEHYACMVYLLGGAGKLTEAYDFIKEMPIEPDLFVWGALLGTCRNLGDLDLAEIAAKHLAKLEPGNAGNNRLLSNLYAHGGCWDTVASCKKMRRKKLRNFLGSSWIESA